MENINVSKDETINELRKIQSTLQDEICTLKAQIGKLKRVATNMNKAFKDLEAQNIEREKNKNIMHFS